MLVALAAWLLLAPALAGAHAGVVAVDRPAEDRVRVEFAAPIEQALAEAQVTDGDGRIVSAPAVRDPRDPRALVVPLVGDPGPRGSLSVRVFSQDGHAEGAVVRLADGSAVETAGTPARSGARPATMAARGMALAGPIALLGLLVLAAWAVDPVVRGGGIRPPNPARGGGAPAGRRSPGAAATDLPGPAARAWWWAAGGSVALWASGLALVPLSLLWDLREGPGGVADLLLRTRTGHAWWVQLGGLAFAVMVLVMLSPRFRRALPATRRAWLAAVGPAVALGAISWAGHASTGPDRRANIGIDILHNLATAAWLGGLLGMMVLLVPLLRNLRAGDRVAVTAGIVVRFSALAVGAVTVLVVSGVYRALAELGSAGDLVDTGYGLALLAKLTIFAVLLAHASVNRFVYHPRLERAALGLEDDDGGAGQALARSVRREVALAAGLLLAVAVMIGLPPPG